MSLDRWSALLLAQFILDKEAILGLQSDETLSYLQWKLRIEEDSRKWRSFATVCSMKCNSNLPLDYLCMIEWTLLTSFIHKRINSLSSKFRIAQEKGVSSRLTVIPMAEYDFALHEGDFRDAWCIWSIYPCQQWLQAITSCFLYHSYYCNNITCSNASETVTLMYTCVIFITYK